MEAAVIGGGLAGLSCARSLQLQGHRVVVYEAGHEVGGRMGVCPTAVGNFDHGAQYFTVRTDVFRKVSGAWRRAGWVARWRARLVALQQGRAGEAGDGRERLVAVPGMNRLCIELSEGLDVRLGQQVLAIEAYGLQSVLKLRASTVAVPATAGPFDVVMLALPPGDAASLATNISEAVAARARDAQAFPCWSLMLDMDRSLGLDYQGAWVRESALSWLANESSKPGRAGIERWVAHATPEWSEQHAQAHAPAVKPLLLKAFGEATGVKVAPLFSSASYWPSARIPSPLPGHCIWDAEARVGACGDWFACGLEGGNKVENAWLSGTALAAVIE